MIKGFYVGIRNDAHFYKALFLVFPEFINSKMPGCTGHFNFFFDFLQFNDLIGLLIKEIVFCKLVVIINTQLQPYAVFTVPFPLK